MPEPGEEADFGELERFVRCCRLLGRGGSFCIFAVPCQAAEPASEMPPGLRLPKRGRRWLDGGRRCPCLIALPPVDRTMMQGIAAAPPLSGRRAHRHGEWPHGRCVWPAKQASGAHPPFPEVLLMVEMLHLGTRVRTVGVATMTGGPLLVHLGHGGKSGSSGTGCVRTGARAWNGPSRGLEAA